MLDVKKFSLFKRQDEKAPVQPAPSLPAPVSAPKPATPMANAPQPAPARPAAPAAVAPRPASPPPAPPKPAAGAKPPLPIEYSSGANSSGGLEAVRFLLHIGDGLGAEFHIDLWHDILKASGIPLLVAIRSRAVFDLVVKTRVNVRCVYVKSGLEAEAVVNACPNLKAILYVSNTGNVVHFVRYPQLRHIFIGHGDSEKSASAHKFFRAYDEVWTAGQAHIDRFLDSGLNFSSIQFAIVGRPTTRWAFMNDRPRKRSMQFLYLPTWENFHAEQNYTSIYMASQILRDAFEATGDMPIAKLHPWTGTVDPSLARASLNLSEFLERLDIRHKIVAKDQNAGELMMQADYLIADISSVVTDFLPVRRPIFIHMPDRAIRLSASKMALPDYCYAFSDSQELAALLDEVIVQGNDYLKEARDKAVEYFIGGQQTRDIQIWLELARVIADPEEVEPAIEGEALGAVSNTTIDASDVLDLSPIVTPDMGGVNDSPKKSTRSGRR